LTRGSGGGIIGPTRRLPSNLSRQEPALSTDKVDSVRSSSSGAIGRAVNVARGTRLVLDSSSHPQADTLTNSEAFLAGVSSCGVTLIEGHAQETNVPLERMAVTIEGVRTAAQPNRFASVTMRFELAGVSQAQAEQLVETYKGR
jgi:uncharacterized OsmC-like protein